MHDNIPAIYTHPSLSSFPDLKPSDQHLVLTVHTDSSTAEQPSQREYNPPAATVDNRVWIKIDLAILPVVTVIFLLSFLDKSNIGNARVAGLQKELQMSDYQYTLALTVTYIPYILIELPANLCLKRVGPNIMLPAMAALWGLATTFQGFVSSYESLIVCRFFIGLFEGGLLPGIALYLSGFYPKSMLQLRISAFFVSTSLAGAFSGLLASAIVHMDGVSGKPGWAWIFFLEGTFTTLFALFAFFVLPRTPLHVSSLFLTSSDKARVAQVLSNDGVLYNSASSTSVSYPNPTRGLSRTQTWVGQDKFGFLDADTSDGEGSIRWGDVWRTFGEIHVWLLAVAGFFNGAMLGGLAYFMPSIVASLGYAANEAQLMTAPPFAVSFFVSMLFSFFSDKYNKRSLTILVCSVLTTIGYAIFLGSPASPHIRYASLFLIVPGTYSAAPPLATLVSALSESYTARATSIALLTVATNLGGLLSTWLLGEISHAPGYRGAAWVFLAFGLGCGACVSLLVLWNWIRAHISGRSV